MADYIRKLDKYYYNYSQDGLKSFQCHASATFSGQLPPGFQEAWKDFNWQNSRCVYDFSYPGGGVMPLLSFFSGGGDPLATPAKMRKVSNLVNAFLNVWGIFLTSDLYRPPGSGVNYTINRGADSTFTITQQYKSLSSVTYFDANSLATRIVTTTPKGQADIKLGFILTPQGAVPKHMEMEVNNGKTHFIIDLFTQYEEVQGFQLPSTFTLFFRIPGKLFQADFKMSDYQLQTAAQVGAARDNGDTQVVPASSENPGTKHFFWRAKSPTVTVYFLGSVHIRGKTPLQVPEIVEQCFEESNYVGFEYDLTQNEQIKKVAGPYVLAHGSYPPGDCLANHLTPQQWKLLQVIFRKAGINEEKASHLKPSFLSDLLFGHAAQKSGLTPEKGIDEIFCRKAQAAGKPIFGMEFWYEPLLMYDNLNDQEQASFLFGTSKGAVNSSRFMDEILADWKTGNTTDMDSLFTSGITPVDKFILEKIIKARNEKWLAQLDRVFQQSGTYFIVVGGGHLVGTYGLPYLLSQKGYQVDQL
jgi:hypothetical protein